MSDDIKEAVKAKEKSEKSPKNKGNSRRVSKLVGVLGPKKEG